MLIGINTPVMNYSTDFIDNPSRPARPFAGHYPIEWSGDIVKNMQRYGKRLKPYNFSLRKV